MNLIERLKTVGKDYDFHDNALIYEAADEIERLERQVAQLEELLKEAYADADDVLRPRIAQLEAALREAESKVENLSDKLFDVLVQDMSRDKAIATINEVLK